MVKNKLTAITRWFIGTFFVLAILSVCQPKSAPTPVLEVIQPETTPTLTSEPPTQPESNKQEATLIRVIDGDTVEASISGSKQTIRVIGIDTPETVDPRKRVECFGTEASKQAKLYFEGNEQIWLESDSTQSDRDKYGRLLRYIFTDDGSVDYGRVMITLGYANEYTYSNPYKYQSIYQQAEQEARDGKKGLWADDACVATPNPTAKPITNSQPVAPATSVGKKSCSGPDLDCGDFSSRSEVRQFWNACGFSASNDPHRLDGSDQDGQPCESL